MVPPGGSTARPHRIPPTRRRRRGGHTLGKRRDSLGKKPRLFFFGIYLDWTLEWKVKTILSYA